MHDIENKANVEKLFLELINVGNPYHDVDGKFCSKGAAGTSLDNAEKEIVIVERQVESGEKTPEQLQELKDKYENALKDFVAASLEGRVFKEITGEFPTKRFKNVPESRAEAEKIMKDQMFSSQRKKASVVEPQKRISDNDVELGKLKDRLSFLQDKAYDLDDAGLDIMDRSSTIILDDIADGNTEMLKRDLDSLEDNLTDFEATRKRFKKHEGVGTFAKNAPADPVEDKKIRDQMRKVSKIARMFDDSGLDVLDSNSAAVLRRYTNNDYDGAHKELHRIIVVLSTMNQRVKWFRDSDKQYIDDFVKEWNADAAVRKAARNKKRASQTHKTHLSIPERIKAAGIKHPDSWDDMGASEKDLWEDRQIANLDRLNK